MFISSKLEQFSLQILEVSEHFVLLRSCDLGVDNEIADSNSILRPHMCTPLPALFVPVEFLHGKQKMACTR